MIEMKCHCYHPPTKLQECNVFTRVCLFVCQFMWLSVQGPISPLPDTFKLWPHCTGHGTASGRYSSFLNAFLLLTVFLRCKWNHLPIIVVFSSGFFTLHEFFFTIETNPCFACMWVAVPSFLYCSHMLVLQPVFKIQKHRANSVWY